MKVLVCGDRNWTDWRFLREALDRFHAAVPFSAVIEGGARGADAMACAWAAEHGIVVRVFPADWRRHGKAAGPIRNGVMLAVGQPDLVLAFHNDIACSKGTRDMVLRAQRANVQTYVLSPLTVHA